MSGRVEKMDGKVKHKMVRCKNGWQGKKMAGRVRTGWQDAKLDCSVDIFLSQKLDGEVKKMDDKIQKGMAKLNNGLQDTKSDGKG